MNPHLISKNGNPDPPLSEGIGQLVNLETLILEDCENLESLPAGVAQQPITF